MKLSRLPMHDTQNSGIKLDFYFMRHWKQILVRSEHRSPGTITSRNVAGVLSVLQTFCGMNKIIYSDIFLISPYEISISTSVPVFALFHPYTMFSVSVH